MRKQLHTQQPAAFRFRRWSRKRYAAFVSLRRAVTIGQLAACVAERFQLKNGANHTSILLLTADDRTGEPAVDETDREGESALRQLWMEQAAGLVQPADSRAAAAQPFIYPNKYRQRGKSQESTEASRVFFFLLKQNVQ